MIPLSLLLPDIQQFIKENEQTPLDKLLLKGSPFKEQDISIQEIVQQIEGRVRTKNKLPLWYHTPDILYPPKLHLEQSSSESTAIYKSKLMASNRLLDLTGGFGVDSYYFARESESVTHIELDNKLSQIASHNFRQLGVSNIETMVGDGITHLKQDTSYDTIFIDPARRSKNKTRVFLLEDCAPNILEHLDLLLNICDHLWIKTAPLLDISLGIKSLQKVMAIHIVAVKNEVKEILWQVSLNVLEDPINLTIVNLETDQASLRFTREESLQAKAAYSLPKTYLYEPNAALLKSGAFKWVSDYFKIFKLHEHTHLYTSDQRINFPGRRFRIQSVYRYSKRLQKELGIRKAHIATRNFRLSVSALRKKLSIEDGGDLYLFFTTQIDGTAIALVCKKE